MFGRFASEEIFLKKKKNLYRKQGKTYETKQENKKDQCYLYLGTRVLRSVLGYPSKYKFLAKRYFLFHCVSFLATNSPQRICARRLSTSICLQCPDAN